MRIADSAFRVMVFLGLFALVPLQSAFAQDVQQFHPAVGSWNYLSLDGARVSPRGRLSASFFVNYASSPLVKRDDAGNIEERIIEDLTFLELMAALGLNDRTEIGFALPLGYSSGATDPDIDDGGGLGDLRLMPKFVLLGARKKHGLGLAVRAPITFPTSDANHEHSERHFTATPGLIIEHRNTWGRVAVNVGYRWLPTRNTDLPSLALGDGLRYGVAVAAKPGHDRVELLVEGFGSSYKDLSRDQAAQRPFELLAGLRIHAPGGLALTLSGGGGLVSDFGAPEFRVLGGLSWAMDGSLFGGGRRGSAFFSDSDDDGVKDDADRCPERAEDVDGYQDSDGCPDADNDSDGLLDAQDKCPQHAEDLDGHEDADGCPDPDNDGDGVLDAQDRCPNRMEDVNGVSDEDGCPDDEVVVVERDRIRSMKRTYFERGASELSADSHAVLNQIAEAIKSNPAILKVRVEGHTDAKGSNAYNERLAQRRANAVRAYLIAQGVEGSRLIALGLGERVTVGTGKGDDADLSRRVEFLIVEREEGARPLLK